MLQTWKRRVELADMAVSRQSGGNFAVDRCRLFRPGVSFRKVRRRAVAIFRPMFCREVSGKSPSSEEPSFPHGSSPVSPESCP